MRQEGNDMTSGKRQVKILVDGQLAAAFKAACRDSGISMASELAGYMAMRTDTAKKMPPQGKPVRTGTRRDRRCSMRAIVSMLTSVRDAEEAYMDRIPDSLRNGPAYEAAECAVCAIDEAISLLSEAFG
jgi:hypothetical protein